MTLLFTFFDEIQIRWFSQFGSNSLDPSYLCFFCDLISPKICFSGCLSAKELRYDSHLHNAILVTNGQFYLSFNTKHWKFLWTLNRNEELWKALSGQEFAGVDNPPHMLPARITLCFSHWSCKFHQWGLIPGFHGDTNSKCLGCVFICGPWRLRCLPRNQLHYPAGASAKDPEIHKNQKPKPHLVGRKKACPELLCRIVQGGRWSFVHAFLSHWMHHSCGQPKQE